MVEELLAAVADRIRRATADDGEQLFLLLEPDADREVGRLLDSIRSEEAGVVLQTDSYATIGWFHYCRGVALSGDGQTREVARAVAAFGMYITAASVLGVPDAGQLPRPLAAAVLSHLDQGVAQELLARARVIGDPGLHRSVTNLWRGIVDGTPADEPERVPRLGHQGIAFHYRFHHLGDSTDLEVAIASLQEALTLVADDAPERAWCLDELGDVLESRFRRTRDYRDLDAAVAASQAAVRVLAPDHHMRPTLWMYLGRRLYQRYDSRRGLGFLHAATEQIIRVMQAAEPPASFSASREDTHRDLDDALAAFQEALDTMATDNRDRAVLKIDIAVALQSRFEIRHKPDDIDASRAMVNAGLSELTRAGHTDLDTQAWRAADLARSRFAITGDLADLDTSIRAYTEGLDAMPPVDPHRAARTRLLADQLLDRFFQTQADDDIDAAVCLYDLVVQDPSGHPLQRILAAERAARIWAPTSIGTAADILASVVPLLADLLPRHLGRADRYQIVSTHSQLASRAVALVLADAERADQEREALRLLEAGRTPLLKHDLELLESTADLRHRHPELADRLLTIREAIDRSEDEPGLDRLGLAGRLHATIAEIRSLDGFDTFGLPPTDEELVADSAAGPIVLINVGSTIGDRLIIGGRGILSLEAWEGGAFPAKRVFPGTESRRSHAIIVTPAGVTALELAGLDQATLLDKLNTFRHWLNLAMRFGAEPAERRAAQQQLCTVLEWLWDVVAGPVLDALGPTGQADRIWFSPGGLLGLLPLHAAGYHADPPGPGRRTVIDRVVPSYVSSIRALRLCRARRYQPVDPVRALVVTTADDLPFATVEADRVSRLVPAPTLLADRDSTKRAVLARLDESAIAHFACHSVNHLSDPSQSRLVLADHDTDPLTVADLTRLDLPSARLAYLSACHTAVPETSDPDSPLHLLDEAIHLASSFQRAGFPHVIGTMWEINDEEAAVIAESFYAGLRTDDGTVDVNRAAQALNVAVRAARDRYPRTPSLWASHLHLGA